MRRKTAFLPQRPVKLADKSLTKPAAFTLVELLVVVAVIMILAITILPGLARTKSKDQLVTCLNNLKQMSLDTIVYVNDNQGVLIRPTSDLWVGPLLAQNNGLKGTLICPAAPYDPAFSPPPGDVGALDKAWYRSSTGDTDVVACSYAFNGWLYVGMNAAAFRNDVPNANSYLYNNASSITQPALTPIFADSYIWDAFPMENDRPYPNLYVGNGFANPPGLGRFIIPRHGPTGAVSHNNMFPPPTRKTLPPGGINVGCFDGHVEYASLPTLWNYSWHKNWNLTNTPPQ